MEELNIRELRERLRAFAAEMLRVHDAAGGAPYSGSYVVKAKRIPQLVADIEAALLSSAEAREEAQARVADWTERLQAICEQASCPPGLNRFDFIANRLAALQAAETRAQQAEARVGELTRKIEIAHHLCQGPAPKQAVGEVLFTALQQGEGNG